MAHSTSYAQLIADVKRWCDHAETDFNTELDQIIGRAQDRLQRDLDLQIWRSLEAITLSSGSSTYDTSGNDWLTIADVYLSDGTPLRPRSWAFVRMFSGTGTPRYFCVREEATLYIAPQPTADTSATCEVMVRQAILDGTNTTNWFTKYAADALLWSSCMEAELFLEAPERAARFEGLYQTALRALIKEHRGHMRRTEYNDPKAVPPAPREVA